MPTRVQGDLPADPQVLRTINAHADHCLGVYANVAAPGMLAEGDPLELEPATASSAPAAVARSGATALKRGTLRVFDALMPRGE
jgi:MOSC domain-containing protein YiiM